MGKQKRFRYLKKWRAHVRRHSEILHEYGVPEIVDRLAELSGDEEFLHLHGRRVRLMTPEGYYRTGGLIRDTDSRVCFRCAASLAGFWVVQPLRRASSHAVGLMPIAVRWNGGDVWTWDRFTVDHVMPRSLGGSEEIENLRLMCRHCNFTKADTAMPIPEKHQPQLNGVHAGELRVLAHAYPEPQYRRLKSMRTLYRVGFVQPVPIPVGNEKYQRKWLPTRRGLEWLQAYDADNS